MTNKSDEKTDLYRIRSNEIILFLLLRLVYTLMVQILQARVILFVGVRMHKYYNCI